jgi:hypothetical protein
MDHDSEVVVLSVRDRDANVPGLADAAKRVLQPFLGCREGGANRGEKRGRGILSQFRAHPEPAPTADVSLLGSVLIWRGRFSSRQLGLVRITGFSYQYRRGWEWPFADCAHDATLAFYRCRNRNCDTRRVPQHRTEQLRLHATICLQGAEWAAGRFSLRNWRLLARRANGLSRRPLNLVDFDDDQWGIVEVAAGAALLLRFVTSRYHPKRPA